MKEPSRIDRRNLMLGRVSRGARTPGIENHISSLIVHARPELAASVASAVGALPGAEIHARDPIGKMVVTLESQSEFEIVQSLGAIQELPGVLSASLVFHHCEAEQL